MLKKLFGIQSLSDAVAAILMALITTGFVIVAYIQHSRQYHYFTFDSMNKDEFFMKRVENKTLVVYKHIDARSGYPIVEYKVLEANTTLYGGSILVGEFNPYPSGVIFEDKNGTLRYLDQYENPKLKKALQDKGL